MATFLSLSGLADGGGSSSSQTALLATALAATAIPLGMVLTKRMLKSDEEKDLPPYPSGPKGNFLTGNMFSNQPDFEKGETFDTKNLEGVMEHGLIFSVRIPLVIGRIIVVADPDLAKRILVTKTYPKSFFYKMLEPLLGPKGLVNLEGQDWANMRKAFNPGFAPTFLQNMTITMAEKLERFLGKIDTDISGKAVTNMLKESQSFTSDVIVQIAFGEDWGQDSPHPARQLEDEICTLYSGLVKSIFRRVFDIPTKRRMYQVGEELDAEMGRILERRLQATTSKEGNLTTDEQNAKDILSLAIAHMLKEKKDGEGLDTEDKAFIIDQLKTFYFAGHDTTATTISWAMWELSKHPEALKTLREELQEHKVWTSGDFSAKGAPTYDQLQKCVFLGGVINESLRLYPPASGLSRECADPNEVYEAKDGTKMRIGGALLIVSSYSMHRHPELWKEPQEFRPQRFIDGTEEDINGKFLPFSKGKRDCIGKYFAVLEAKLAISALAMKYDLECDDPNDYMEQILTNLPAKGAKVKFHPRA